MKKWNPRITRGKRRPCDRQVFSERPVAARFIIALATMGIAGHSYICKRCGALHVSEEVNIQNVAQVLQNK